MNVDALATQWARYPILWSPQVSGDGKWLAWTWTGLTETGEVCIEPTDGSKAPERLTDGKNHFHVRSLSQNGGKLVLAQSIGSNEHDQLLLLDRRAARIAMRTIGRRKPAGFSGWISRQARAPCWRSPTMSAISRRRFRRTGTGFSTAVGRPLAGAGGERDP